MEQKVDNLFCEVNENMKAYSVGNHRHTPEIEEQLGYAAGKKITLNLYASSGSYEQRNPGYRLCFSDKAGFL